MVLLSSFIAGELLVVLSIAMYINGRCAAPSIWIRSDLLLGVVANVAVSLLLGVVCGLVATAYQWWLHGVQVPHLWLIVLSVAITFWVVKRINPRGRLAGIAALAAAAAAAVPQAVAEVIPEATLPAAKSAP